MDNITEEVEVARAYPTTPNEEIMENNYNQWAIYSGDKYAPTMPTTKQIPAGFYEVNNDPSIGTHLIHKKINTDELYYLPSPELLDIIKDVNTFWERKEKYKQYGFLHKRGILMYGDPGMGKSGIIQLCTKYLIEEMNGIVINLTSGGDIELYSTLIGTFRDIEGSRPLVVILEDIDAIAGEGSWSTSMLLNILDGVKQINNVVYIATTNYPERLQERITNRPSRFDRRYEIEAPKEAVRKTYIENKLSKEDLDSIDMKEWLKETEGMSLAHMRELIISLFAMGNSFEDTIARLNGLKVKPEIKAKNVKISLL